MTIKSSIITLTGEYTIANGEDNLRTKAGRQTLTELVDIVKTLLTKLGIDLDTWDEHYAYVNCHYGIDFNNTTDNKSLARRMHRAIFKDSEDEDDKNIAIGWPHPLPGTSLEVISYRDSKNTIHIEITRSDKLVAQAILEEVR